MAYWMAGREMAHSGVLTIVFVAAIGLIILRLPRVRKWLNNLDPFSAAQLQLVLLVLGVLAFIGSHYLFFGSI